MAETKVSMPGVKPGADNADENEQLSAGATALEKIEILSQEASANRLGVQVSNVVNRAGRSQSGSGTSSKNIMETDLPYAVTSVDLTFVANMAAVPAILKKFETSPRFYCQIAKVDTQRAAPLYPVAADPRVAKLGAVPGLNTYYMEGPVRIAVSLNLLEYDASRENKPAPTEKPAGKKKP